MALARALALAAARAEAQAKAGAMAEAQAKAVAPMLLETVQCVAVAGIDVSVVPNIPAPKTGGFHTHE